MLDIILWVSFVLAILSGVAGIICLLKTKNIPDKTPKTLLAVSFVLFLVTVLALLLKNFVL